MTAIHHKLQHTLDKAIDSKKVFGSSFCLRYNDLDWNGASGNLSAENPYFIASTTKLFITAMIMQLRQQNKLSLDDKIAKYFSADILRGLHDFKGHDWSAEITIRDLLAHTSGIPDYFQGKNKAGSSLEKELQQGRDRHWTFEEAIALSKTLTPKSAPQTKGKALYSDTNFQLMGRIVEYITEMSLDKCLEEMIFLPLQLSSTYMYRDAGDTKPKNMYFKEKELPIPLAMTSFGADGGIVSTSQDMLKFIGAFFAGVFFPTYYLEEMKVWNPIFAPMRSGIGIHLFKLPRIFDPLNSFPELYGHSGLSGALAYCNPERKLYIAGTVNQIAYPSTSFKLAMKLISICLRG